MWSHFRRCFALKRRGFTREGKITGQFQASGIIPTFIEKFEQKGVKIPRDIFTTKASSDIKNPNKISVKVSAGIARKPLPAKPAAPSAPKPSPAGFPQKGFKKIIKRPAG